MITPSSVIFDRELFFECGPFNESLPACEDYDLWLRITCRYPIGLVPEFHLTRYGGHQDQLSSIIPILDRYRIRSILQLLYHSQLTPQQRSDAISICKSLYHCRRMLETGKSELIFALSIDRQQANACFLKKAIK
jgi:hypothetical protein